MMWTPRLAAHRSALITAGAITAVVAVVAGAALASGGYAAQRVDLGDASVWVVNDGENSIGRANTALLELNSVVLSGSASAEVVQQGSTVLVLDRDRASVGIVDPATSTIVESVAVPPDDPSVALAGSRVVVASAGDVWSVPAELLADFDSESDPALTFGAGTVTSVDPSGVLFAYTPTTGDIARVDAADEETVDAWWQIPPVEDHHQVQITSINGRWVVLDATAGVLHFEGRADVDLTRVLESPDLLSLQLPSASGDTVAVAHRRGLLVVDVDGGDPRVFVEGVSGTPAAPIEHGGCLHAAWASGEAWRSCGDDGADGGTPIRLENADGSGEFAFRVNGSALALNDARSGVSWAAADDYGVIDNWNELLASERDEKTVELPDAETPPIVEKSQVPPVAVADEFGARPGRSTLLPVLLNDYDANGDALVIEATDGDLPPWAHLERVAENQQLQLRLEDAASGAFSFGYTISDGHEATVRAVVTVSVREPDENGPPAPAEQRVSRASVVSGGRVTASVLGDWVDPDGDPVFLKSASAGSGDVSWTAEGVVVFTERGGGAGSEHTVSLVVSDGREERAGTLTIDVHAPGAVPPIAEPFVVLATADKEIRVDPLRHVRGGSGPIRLSAVPAKPDAVLTPDFDGGSFRFTSAVERTHFLEYTVTDGYETATGIVRVEVSAPHDRNTKPITVPHTAFVRPDQAVDVDVLATDIDPTGGVLVVSGVVEPVDPAIRVEVIDHRILRVTSMDPDETGPTAFGYTVSNGLGEAVGEVTVVRMPPLAIAQPPVAAPDTIAARTGDVVDIPVLANDEHPDQLSLTLSPELVAAPASGQGLLFVAGDRLRYFAPDDPGEFTARYEVTASDGQFAPADVSISVRPADPDTNSPPVPPAVTARVLAGDKVRIPIPLGGVDPDGDSVQLLSQESNPERGTVIDRGADWLEYQAGDYSAGTDTFQYSVIDALGARAVGSIRVGIAAPLSVARAPVAVDDVVTVRPGRTISVRVLENDSDPDGDALSVQSIETIHGDVEATTVDGHTVQVAVPPTEGDLGFIYTAANDHLGTASAFLRVEAREDAPLARPEAHDTVLSLSDILDKEVVDVEVLRNVFLADDDVADAVVGLVPGYDEGARVRRDGSVRIEVEDRQRIIPFSVSHPDDPENTAHAFIWVPGRDDALPQLRRDAPKVQVRSGEEVQFELEEFVIAASGRPVRITDTASVRASHSDGTDLVVDHDTLRFRSASGYYGPASLSFTVTDGESATDPGARTGTIVIPIDVKPADDQPPAFTGGVVDFEPGQSKTIDLLKLTNYLYPDKVEELQYRVLPPAAEGFGTSLNDRELTITAADSTPTGTRGLVSIAVADAAGVGPPGRIELRVVPSTRPIARPAPDHAVVARGRTTTIDVLENDRATNPFPDTPLRVVGVRGLGQNLPPGVHIDPSDDRSTLTVRVDERADPVDTTLHYQVADATGEPSRYATGTVVISVQDRPDPVTGPQVTGFGDGYLDVTFGAGGFNNSPITGYEIALVDPADGAVRATSTCDATTCTVPTPGNGEGNPVLVRVQARNAIGLSDPVEAPGPVWSDVIPPPPQDVRAVPLDGGLEITWSPVSAGAGSEVESYVVTVAGVASQLRASACTTSSCSTRVYGLFNGSQVPFTVSARNQAYPALAAWTEAGGMGVPFGAPIAGAIDVSPNAAAGTVTVSWTPFDGNGDGIGGYFVQRLADGQTSVPTGPQACSVTSPPPGQVVPPSSGGTVAEVVQVGPDASSVEFAGAVTESTTYAFVVWGYNRSACVNTQVAGVVVRPAPGAVTGVQSRMDWMNAETWDRYVDRVDSGGSSLQIVAVDANGAQIGQPQQFAGSGWLRAVLNRPFGESARFQVRSCSIWGSCGPWSAVFPADARPSLTFALPTRAWDGATATWSWMAAPDNAGLPAAFRCGVDGQGEGRNAQTATTCQIPNAQPADRVWLDVEIAGVTARYWNR
ncbi:fibronectin type III domain-containing protein [Agromyces sp. Marseille-P2726]|uniref:fibronectin type III domain-containing protein n=1 Tax=Agromyces sp. Marseille-P2726 TaxID=2709132 RepID=UPI0015704068|nr:fibronectin type III domain-containing protein [Agromyces sp. Marseille-P2726]